MNIAWAIRHNIIEKHTHSHTHAQSHSSYRVFSEGRLIGTHSQTDLQSSPYSSRTAVTLQVNTILISNSSSVTFCASGWFESTIKNLLLIFFYSSANLKLNFKSVCTTSLSTGSDKAPHQIISMTNKLKSTGAFLSVINRLSFFTPVNTRSSDLLHLFVVSIEKCLRIANAQSYHMHSCCYSLLT